VTQNAGGQAPASSLLLTKEGPRAGASRERVAEVAVPVYNEEKVLASLRLDLFFHIPGIADNSRMLGEVVSICPTPQLLCSERPHDTVLASS
jgi:hypothetical protein